MELCLMCDLHLPFDRKALQYDVLRWAIKNIHERRPDCILFAGDATCDGNEETYDWFVDAVTATDIRFLYIPGNSDLRCAGSRESVSKKASECLTRIKGVSIFAINDCDETISPKQLALLKSADENSIVFMHHPLTCHQKETADRLSAWRATHRDTMVFYGHSHRFEQQDHLISLQAMDPDKAIGECPCIAYYDTETGKIDREYYSVAVPADFCQYFGISCYSPIEQIQLAARHHLKHLELRPNCHAIERSELKKAVEQWRHAGGECLSIHLPDVGWSDGKLSVHQAHAGLVGLVKELKADRVTQHVPAVSVGEVRRHPEILKSICDYLAGQFNAVPHDFVIGIENMHMTSRDSADENRRFGYVPEECIRFMQLLAQPCRQKVGINFDIGHARNNAPYSQKYQISTWLSMVGQYIVGYHLHQVVNKNGQLENHMPITDLYGPLINYVSLFKVWSTGRVNKAPVILEMRPADAYEKTLATFELYRSAVQ